MTLPAMCGYHEGIFHRLDEARKRRVRHPGDGHKALAKRAADIAGACPQCPDPPRRR